MHKTHLPLIAKVLNSVHKNKCFYWLTDGCKIVLLCFVCYACKIVVVLSVDYLLAIETV